MGKISGIEWTEATWNPWHGCNKVSPGCKNCYMYRDKARYGQDPGTVARSKTTFFDPLRWAEPKLVFACSWSDWFIEQADEWRAEAWEVIRGCPHHTFQILTKRPERILENLPTDWDKGWANVWLGVSIESQAYLERMAILSTVPAQIRFVSAEPLLGPIELDLDGTIHWVITGGESGPRARKMNPEWAIAIRDQSIRSGVRYFHKQNGGSRKIDRAWGGRDLDGRTWNQIPPVASTTDLGS